MSQQKTSLMIRLVLFSTVLLSFTVDGAEPRPWRISDLYEAESFAPVAVSSAKKSAVSVRNWIDPQTKMPRHSLWFSWGDPLQANALEVGQPDGRAPLISPDGKWVAFLSTRSRPEGWKQTPVAPIYSEPTVDIWLIPLRPAAYRAGKKAVAIPLAGPQKPYGRVYPDQNYGLKL